jgi:hypothetical protein
MAEYSLKHFSSSLNNNSPNDILYVSLSQARALTQVALGDFVKCDAEVINSYLCALDDLIEKATQAFDALECKEKKAKEEDTTKSHN